MLLKGNDMFEGAPVPGSILGTAVLAIAAAALVAMIGPEWGLLKWSVAAGLLVAAVAVSPVPARVSGVRWQPDVRRAWLGLAGLLLLLPMLAFGLIVVGEVIAAKQQDRVGWPTPGLLRLGAMLGVASEQNSLANLYLKGNGVTASPERARTLYMQAAKHGEMNAQRVLGLMYFNGEGGVAKDEAAGVRLLRRSAEQGNVGAMLDLGFAYEKGRGVEEDPVRALQLYEDAAAKGEAEANLRMGLMYAEGRGTAQDAERARGLYRVAADADDPRARLLLAEMLMQGKGGARDTDEARRQLEAAARGNDAGVAKVARETLDLM